MILIGTHYEYPFGGMATRPEWLPKNKEDWRRDLEMIRDTGFNSIRIRIGMDSNLDDVAVLLDLAQEFELKVLFGFATFYVPDWFVEKYPDSKIIDRKGEAAPKDKLDFRWQRACINHPEYRRMRNRILNDCAKRFKDHPAVIAWCVHNEPGIGPGEYPCYCKYTLSKYRKVLANEFGSIDRLNLAFGSSFINFEQVSPPKKPEDNGTAWRHWREFIAQNLSEFLLEGRAIIKKHDPHARVTYNVTSPFIIETTGQNWWTCRKLDFLSMSQYAGSDEFTVSRWSTISFLKSLDEKKEVWITEYQGGPFPYRNTMYTGKHIEVELNSALSRGIRGLFFYRWEPLLSGPEPWVNGMTEVDDYNTERRLRTKEAIANLQPFSHILEKGKNRKPRIGIYLRRNHILYANERHLPIQEDIEGYYALLSDLGYEVGMILDKFNSSCDYDLVIFPFTYESIEDLPAIQEYLQLGNRVIFELPSSDLEKGRTIAQKLQLEVSGREAPIYFFAGWDLREVSTELSGEQGKFAGFAGHERILLKAPSYTTMLSYGDNNFPAAVSSNEYENRMLVLSFPLGRTYRTTLHWGVRNFIGNFIAEALQPDVKIQGIPKEYRPLIEARLLETEKEGLLFIMNRSVYEFTANVEVAGYEMVTCKLPIYGVIHRLLKKK